MSGDGWVGDASRAPWWMFFVVLGICVSVSLIFGGAIGLLNLYSAEAAALAAPIVIAGLFLGIRRGLQWMYGSNLGERGQSEEPPPEASAPHADSHRSITGFNAAVVLCLIVLACVIGWYYTNTNAAIA